MKKVVVCGASGMVGTRLVQLLHEKSCPLVLVGRTSQPLKQKFPFAADCYSWEEFSASPVQELGVIINISGAGVSDQSWSDDYKKVMTDSRLNTTNICVEVCKRNPDIRLINASAVSAYGFYDDDHEAFSEADSDRRTGNCFLQELIDQWERATEPAIEAGNPVALLRIGVVFDRSGGGLPAMATPFRYFLGGKSGTGNQIMSWISLRDLVAAIGFIFDHPQLNGPINLVSPGSCSNRVFAQSLGQALNRPSFVSAPVFLIKAIMGQMGQELVLTGQRVSPSKLLDAGFVFQDQDIKKYLREIYRH
ncbi:TIGR01777 family oxidoreductase [Nodularia harveyana UHCC-0300]|uniref:TIGR01777 family oxidoreductase n=1 Tax=Nodularia harveyana UHCC-0300 TaxID=2974287 RepID=A0ABU5UHJ2_9CYAN|nr:TIGR01777 family oxidoreductase [Nodularia harveyana]MEA5582699.1 TIGR01777 family oxidoreductase [Nodularia harveyana UHCC-0300]